MHGVYVTRLFVPNIYSRFTTFFVAKMSAYLQEKEKYTTNVFVQAYYTTTVANLPKARIVNPAETAVVREQHVTTRDAVLSVDLRRQ
jgi:hypothetical protein